MKSQGLFKRGAGRLASEREREKVEGQSRDQKGEKMLSGYEDERRGHKSGNIGAL